MIPTDLLCLNLKMIFYNLKKLLIKITYLIVIFWFLVVIAKTIHTVYLDLVNNVGFKIKCVLQLMTMKIQSLNDDKIINLLV